MKEYRVIMEIVAKVIAEKDDEAVAEAQAKLCNRKGIEYKIKSTEVFLERELKECFPPDCDVPRGKPSEPEFYLYYFKNYCTWREV
ncbi:MAG: hypothetical protein QME61_02015 [Patescibacteria group bacterium]|nr:hypothetical protein [Patescibacteria group bacterium]